MKFRARNRRGASSLVYLGFSIIVFVITFGILFTLIPMILGAFFSVLPPVMNASWQATNVKTQSIIQFVIPLTASFGLMLFTIKVLMAASAKGND